MKCSVQLKCCIYELQYLLAGIFPRVPTATSIVKSFPVTGPVWPRGWVEVYLFSNMTAALQRGERSEARPGRTLPPGKTWYPFYSKLGRPQGQSGRVENLVPTGIRSRTVQPVVGIATELPSPLCTAYRSYILPTKVYCVLN